MIRGMVCVVKLGFEDSDPDNVDTMDKDE